MPASAGSVSIRSLRTKHSTSPRCRWMSKAHFYHLDREWQTFVNYLKSPCNAARVPFMAPELPQGFVPRPGQLDPLLDALLESGRLNPTPGAAAFYGPGGFWQDDAGRGRLPQ